jgi:hypothetical protein
MRASRDHTLHRVSRARIARTAPDLERVVRDPDRRLPRQGSSPWPAKHRVGESRFGPRERAAQCTIAPRSIYRHGHVREHPTGSPGTRRSACRIARAPSRRATACFERSCGDAESDCRCARRAGRCRRPSARRSRAGSRQGSAGPSRRERKAPGSPRPSPGCRAPPIAYCRCPMTRTGRVALAAAHHEEAADALLSAVSPPHARRSGAAWRRPPPVIQCFRPLITHPPGPALRPRGHLRGGGARARLGDADRRLVALAQHEGQPRAASAPAVP